MLKIKLLFLSELLSSYVAQLIKESGKISLGQAAMARGAFKMLSAGVNKMSEKDLGKVTSTINYLLSDKLIDSLTDENVTATEYALLLGKFIEHAQDANKDTAK